MLRRKRNPQSLSAIIDIYLCKFGDDFPKALKKDIIKTPLSKFIDIVSKKYNDVDTKNLLEKTEKLSESTRMIYDFLKNKPTLQNIITSLNALKYLTYSKFSSIASEYPDFLPFIYGRKGDSYIFNINNPNLIINDNKDVEILNNLLSININNDIIVIEGSNDVITILISSLIDTYSNNTLLIPKNDVHMNRLLSYIIMGVKNDKLDNLFYKLIEYRKTIVFPISSIIGFIINNSSEEDIDSKANIFSMYSIIVDSMLEFASKTNSKVILYGEKPFVNNIKSSYPEISLPITYMKTSDIEKEYNKWIGNTLIEVKRLNNEITPIEYVNFKNILNNNNRTYNIDIKDLLKSPRKILSFENSLSIGKKISKIILGQDDPIKSAIDAISVGCLINKKKPISILLVGPTGTGKTMFGKELAKSFDVPFLQLDMSLYSLEHSLTNILGSPRSYVGYEDPTPFEEFINKINMSSFPSGILILDEVEKAHPKVITSFLMPLLDGEGVTFSLSGKKIPYGLVIIATANGHASDMYEILHRQNIGFESEDVNPTSRDVGKAALGDIFPPELLGRFYSIVEFKKLSKKVLEKIAERGFVNISNTKPTAKWKRQIRNDIKNIHDGRNAFVKGELVALDYVKENKKKISK